MSLRPALEAKITNALTRLSPENMQRVAEDYARITYPDRFPRFDFRAFSPEGRSRKGWPDAWTRQNDGGIDGIEATNVKEKQFVERHLEGYLARAKDCQPRLAGFIHVSGSPAAQFKSDEIASWKARFVEEAGIDPDRLDLVFGGGLVEILARPEFARTRIEILGISEAPVHFKLMRTRISPDERRLNTAFIPTDEDFLAGRVHRAALTDAVVEHLDRRGCALIRGIGASGKSVLAWLIAMDRAAKRFPAYMLDIADYSELTPDIGNAIVADLSRFGHPEVMFVLDNIHLAEGLAKDVFLAWDEMPMKPRLLLIGRETRTAAGSLIDGLGVEALPLRARQPELRGVYRRLALRVHDEKDVPEPPEHVLDEWLAMFGGDPAKTDATADLIAFSAAVARRLDDLCRGNWPLRFQDAIEQVREIYLKDLSPNESVNLCRLCVTEELEIGLSETALADKRAALARCNQQLGIVFRTEVGASGQYVRYRLAHPALGKLLLAADFEQADSAVMLKEIALCDPSAGFPIAARLVASGRLAEAKDILSLLLERPASFLSYDSLFQTHLSMRLVERAELALPNTLGEELSGTGGLRTRLINRALNTPAHFLASFLGYAERTPPLKPVFDALVLALAQEEHRPPLIKRALNTPLGDLATFLRYAKKTDALKPVFDALALALAQEEHRAPLIKRALNTPLGDLANFLGYAERTPPLKPVFDALVLALAQEEHRAPLIKRALNTPLGDLANFLGYAEKTPPLKPVFDALALALAQNEHRAQLIKLALNTPLDHLASFLGYAERTPALKPVFDALADELDRDSNRIELAKSMNSASLDSLISVLGSEFLPDIWRQAFLKIETGGWEEQRKRGPLPKINAFARFQRIAFDLDRLELAKVLAIRIVELSTAADWHSPDIGLHHLSHVVRLAAEVSAEQRERFLSRIATPEWVDGSYETVSTGALAGNLSGLSSALEPGRRSWFIRPRLQERVRQELARMSDKESRAEALALLGSATLLGVICPTNDMDWPNDGELKEILELRAQRPDRETIGTLQVQLWLGLRQMALSKSEPSFVPSDLADRVLSLWEAAHADASAGKLPSHVVASNDELIAWLWACKAAGWQLVSPRR